MTRRKALSTLGNAALVAGFDLQARAWVTDAKNAAGPSFAALPALDGTVLTDAGSREADASDQGNIIHHTPHAVLRPGSVEDIARVVAFCATNGIKVAARGQHGTTFGQGLVSGLIVETQSLNTIHSIDAQTADVDAGVLWSNLVNQAVPFGFTPPVLTAYTKLSIAGTLSVGGMSSVYNKGAQVDQIRALQVVTGEGNVLWCSQTEERDLFEAVLGGIGQCGIITRVKVALTAAAPMARQFTIKYSDVSALFQDMRTLVEREEFSGVSAMYLPTGTPGTYLLLPVMYFDPATPPNNANLLSGLTIAPTQAEAQDTTYLEQVSATNALFDGYMATKMFNQVQKPWFHVFLPAAVTEQYVSEVVPNLTAEDIGPTGVVVILAQRRSQLTRPLLRVPSGGSADLTFLFEILTSAAAPGSNPEFVDRMLLRNRNLFVKARHLGATRYPPDAVPFEHEDWVLQYGDVWERFVAWKNRYDPHKILTPGPGIFSSDRDS